MRAVANRNNLPFKKLDPLELDMDVATKTIPRNFAIRQLLLPFKDVKTVLWKRQVYHPDCQAALVGYRAGQSN